MDRLEAELIAMRILWSYHGTFYSWGGDDPSGFDCSGLAIEWLKSVDLLPRKYDTTAQGLFDLYKAYRCSPKQTALVFFGQNVNTIIHVETCINDKLAIGASGGGRNTKTREDAIRDNAFIKVRGIYSRKNIVAICDPLTHKFN